MSLKTYGVNEPTQLEGRVAHCLEELRWQGFTVLHEVLSSAEVDEARERLDAVYRRQTSEIGEEVMASIGERHLARMPLLDDEWFVGLVTRPEVLEIVRHLLGDYFILHLQNGILNAPGETHHQATFHRDLPYQEWVSSKPLGVSALYCLDAFTQESGATRVIPHSHRFEKYPSEQYVDRFAVTVAAPAGAVIVFDAMLFHGAGPNHSSGMRRGINHTYVAPILKQQIDLPVSLDKKFASDPFLAKLFGYESAVPPSAQEWRRRRRAKFEANRALGKDEAGRPR